MGLGRVYVLQSGDTHYYKIGLTKDHIKRRINELQTGNPFRIKAILVQHVPDMKIAENILHRKYAQYRGIGEWFYLGPAFLYDDVKIDDVIAYIKTELNQEVEHRLTLKEIMN